MLSFSSDEAALVSFGNFLLKKYGVMVFSNDGENKPLFGRQVSDADICNWKEYITELDKEMAAITSDDYEIRHGDMVKVFLLEEINGEFPGIFGRVTAINDKLTKKTYDVELHFYSGKIKTRVPNIDCAFVKKIISNQK